MSKAAKRDASVNPLTPEQRRLVEEHMPMVEEHAARIAPKWPRARREDLVTVGEDILIARAPSYDPSLGTFASYVGARVYYAMVDAAMLATFGDHPGAHAIAKVARVPLDILTEEEQFEAASQPSSAWEARLLEELTLRATSFVGAYNTKVANAEQLLEERHAARKIDQKIQETLEAAPVAQRTLFEHLYVEHTPMKEVAQHLRCSVRHAQRQHDVLKQLIHDAVKALIET